MIYFSVLSILFKYSDVPAILNMWLCRNSTNAKLLAIDVAKNTARVLGKIITKKPVLAKLNIIV